jgi:plasmid stabilization system protein ParE
MVAFHPEALLEYAEAADYYLLRANSRVAVAFVSCVETAVKDINAAPERWPATKEPGIRRHVLRRFPYVIYYRWEPSQERATIYAIMHCSREPGKWQNRIK